MTIAVLVTVDPGPEGVLVDEVAAPMKLLTGTGKIVTLPVTDSVGKSDSTEETTIMLVPEGVSSIFLELVVAGVEIIDGVELVVVLVTTTTEVLLNGRLVDVAVSPVKVVTVAPGGPVLLVGDVAIVDVVESVVVVTTGNGRIETLPVGGGGGYGTSVILVEDASVLMEVVVVVVVSTGAVVAAGHCAVGVVVIVQGLRGQLRQYHISFSLPQNE